MMMEGETKKVRERTPSKSLLESIESQESPDSNSDSETEATDPNFKCDPCLRLFYTDIKLKRHEKTIAHQKKAEKAELEETQRCVLSHT